MYAEESRRPHSLASALIHATILELICGDAEAAARHAARSAKVSAEHAVANFGPMSRFFAGTARAARGDVAGGLAEMLPALEEHRAVVGSHITDIMLASSPRHMVKPSSGTQGSSRLIQVSR